MHVRPKPTVAVDLDGTLAAYDRWRGVDHIGDPLPGAREFLAGLREFAVVVVWTTRCNPDVSDRPAGATPAGLAARVRAWLDHHGLPYDEVFTGPVKPLAAALVDDRAVACRPQDAAGSGGAYDAHDVYEYTLRRVRHLCGLEHAKDFPPAPPEPPAGSLFGDPPPDTSALRR